MFTDIVTKMELDTSARAKQDMQDNIAIKVREPQREKTGLRGF